MINILKDEDGAVLVLSIIIISVIIVLATALAGSINNNISFTKRYENEVKAFYAAEAGIERGINLLKNNRESVEDLISEEDKFFQVNELNDDLNFNNFDLSILKTSDEEYDYTIKSIAEINNLTKEIEVNLVVSSSVSSLFDYAIASNGNLNVNGGELVVSKIDDPNSGRVISSKINHPDNFLNPDGTVKSVDYIEELDKKDNYLNNELTMIKNYFNTAQSKAETINWSDYQDDSSNVVNGETQLNVEGKILLIDGNMTLDRDVLIKGNGILIINGNLNANQSNFHVNYSNGNYLDGYSLIYLSKNANPQINYFKGLLMTESNINTNSGDYEIRGSLFTDNNSNLNHGGTFIHDPGYVDVFNNIAEKYNIDIDDIFADSESRNNSNAGAVKPISWQES